MGGLALTKWTTAPGSSIPSFPHMGDDGKLVAPKDTFARLLERLSTADPNKRMPKQMAMPSQDRQALYLWVQEELARMGKRP